VAQGSLTARPALKRRPFSGIDNNQQEIDMNVFEAVQIVEGNTTEEPSYDTFIEAWQVLIDTGMAWQLQGWFGRHAAALIDAGECEA
jgi:hypothetical protein